MKTLILALTAALSLSSVASAKDCSEQVKAFFQPKLAERVINQAEGQFHRLDVAGKVNNQDWARTEGYEGIRPLKMFVTKLEDTAFDTAKGTDLYHVEIAAVFYDNQAEFNQLVAEGKPAGVSGNPYAAHVNEQTCEIVRVKANIQ